MPGRISKNLRSGFLHEELGILLVRQLAVVAPVPRPDDVGNDAVATLLKPPVATLQYADASFYLQFKAQSVAEVRYNYHPETHLPQERGEVNWLKGLQLPFFIGSVDNATSSIRLYTMQHAYAEMIRNEAAASLKIRFGPEPDPLEAVPEAGGNAAAHGGAAPNPAHPTVYLGNPILEWNITSHNTAGFYQSAYDVLKPWSDLEHSNCFTRKLKLLQKATWETGQPPTVPDDHVVITSSVTGPGDAEAILKLMKPAIRCLLLDRIIRGTEQDVQLLDQLIVRSRELGVDPCSEGLRAILGEAGAEAKAALEAGG